VTLRLVGETLHFCAVACRDQFERQVIAQC
jgi:hypothetical protein